MEPSEGWIPYDLELGSWTVEPAAYAPRIPTMEYTTNEIFGNGFQTSVVIRWDGGEQQHDEVATLSDTSDSETTEQENYNRDDPPDDQIKELAYMCHEELKGKKFKMHRYPAIIQANPLYERYTTPKVVAIGPYNNHGCRNLKEAEKMKTVAAYQCVKDSTRSIESMYAFVPVADSVRSRYNMDMEGISCHDFLNNVFLDTCFLVQWMLIMSDGNSSVNMEPSLSSFFDTYNDEIFHDIMLLENQIPWPMVEAIMEFCRVPMDKFIYFIKHCLQLQDHKYPKEEPPFVDNTYKPPHLLGLLRFYIVGKSRAQWKKLTPISLPDSATELAEIGVRLKAKENTDFADMGAKKKCICSVELFLVPVSLDEARASCLLSMAALELCTTSDFLDAKDEDSAVCSYLLLLAMLAAKDEDVGKLRKWQVLQGVGLSNKEVTDFTEGLRDLRVGSNYARSVFLIQEYKNKYWWWIKIYAVWYRHKKTIIKLGTFLASVAGILGAIFTGIQTFKKSPDNPCCCCHSL